MRSQAIATFMAASGTPSVVLQGGYKSFRRANLQRLAQNWDIVLIGGYTGCGKTEILHALRERGEQVLDLENLAQHRGSAYGQRAGCTQPSNEQFENLIAWELQKVDPERPVWVEDESRMIGTCHIPSSFYTQMSEARLFLVERPMVERLHCLRKVYEGLDHAYLHEATCRLRKRLGEERTRQIIELGEAGLFDEAVQQVLQYYDKAYTHSIRRRQQPQSSHYAEGWSANDWADFLLKTLKRTSTAPIPPTCAYKRDKQSGTCAL
jgi:tRNA 2-selenouridine synthase